ncbi:hypothetical protein, partial [Staphylococcus aureus]
DEQVDQTTSSSSKEVSVITEKSQEKTHAKNTIGKQDNKSEKKNLQPSCSNQNGDMANDYRPRTIQQNVATIQAVQ